MAHRRYPFLLESGSGFGELGRYTFWGTDPFLILRAKGRSIEIEDDRHTERLNGNPLEVLRQLLREHTMPCNPNDPPLASGGAVGYLGYDLRHFVEDLPKRATDDLHLPDLWMGFYRRINIDEQRESFEFRVRELSTRNPEPGTSSTVGQEQGTRKEKRRVTSTFSKAAYLEAVRRVQGYILAGDVYQVNLSQRFEVPIRGAAADFYEQLTRMNPAPFAARLDCGEFSIVSVSPERFLKFDPVSRLVETRPIKGTHPRGKIPEEDEALAAELSRSEKDRAEHLMIVDLERNDLGRVCEVGSVHVPELWRLERHPTVWHLVSTVRGKLRPGLDRIDLIRATFPGGSITGAPKIRAMEIIDEVEPTVRGIYTGAIGYVGFDGRMDLSIAIRMATVRDGMAYFHVGGGIVADSDPEMEYQETLDKARAIFEVVLSR
jgi:para-aminobenzoate synthetase component 1